MSDNTLNVAALVVPTVSATTLVLIGPDQQLTYQISADVTDLYGNVIDAAPLYYLSYDPSICTVSDSGLITAVGEPGNCVIEIASPTGGNECGFADNGLPLVKIYALLNVLVQEGQAVIPSFTLSGSDLSADASSGTASTTLTVTPSDGFTGTLYLFGFTQVSTFENNAQSVQSLASSTSPGQIVGFPLISSALTSVTWNYRNAKVNITSGEQTFGLVLTWDGDNPPPTGTYSFSIIGSTTARWQTTAPLSPNVSTLALTLTLT